MRRALLLIAALLAAPAARAQDWDVAPTRPSRPARPSRPTRPSRPATPRRAQPAPQAAVPDRRERAIEHLRDALLRNTADASAMLPALTRMIRERDGSLDALLTDLRARADAAPPSAAATFLLGELMRQEGRLEEALARLGAAATLSPEDPAPHRSLGELHRQMDHRAEAQRHLNDALRLTRDRTAQADILRALTALAVAGGDIAAARSHHARLTALFAGSVAVRRELADALMTQRQYREAVTEFEALSRALAGDNRVLPASLRDLGRAQLRAGDADAALVTLRRALRIVGGDVGVRRELYDEITEIYTQRNELDGWITELQTREPPSHEKWMLLGRLLAARGRTDEAIAATRRAVDLRPREIDGHIALIQLLTQAARLDELLVARRRLVAAAPRSPQYVTDLADDLLRTGRRAEALQLLAQASARAGGDSEVHERLAQAYARLGEPRLALRETELMARAAPDDPDALEALGERYLEQGDEGRAVNTWARIRDAARDRAHGLAALAEVYARHDRLNEALASFREAVALRDDQVDWHKGLAMVQERLRLLDPAIASWRRVLELASGQREVQREARGRIVNLWQVQGRLGAMVPSLERAFRGSPRDLEAGRDLAESLARLRRHDEAEAVLGELAVMDPGDVPTLVTLERVRAQRGDLDGAIEVLRRLVEADARNAREWYQRLAAHALALHRDEEALDAAAHAVRLNPDDANGHLRVGELYRARGNTASAIASLRRALALNDRLFPTYFQLADLHLGRDEPRDAIDLYRRVIRLAQDDELVARAGRTAVQLAVATESADELERDLLAASAASPARVVLRRLLVDLYRGLAHSHINALRFGDAEAVTRARAALARYGSRALKPLLDTLSEADSPQREPALELLGHLGNPGAAPALLTLVEREDAPLRLRRVALRAAAAVADARVLPRLVALITAPDGVMAGMSLWALARVDTPAARAALLRALADASRPQQQATSALLLTGRRDPALRAALLRVVDSSSNDLLRGAALLALGHSGDPVASSRATAITSSGYFLSAAGLALAPRSVPDPRRCAELVSPSLFSATPSPVSQGPALAQVAAAALASCGDAPSSEAIRARIADPELASNPYQLFAALLGGPPGDEAGSAALQRFTPQIAAAAGAAMLVPATQAPVRRALLEPAAFPPLVARAAAEALAPARGAIISAVSPSLRAMATWPDERTRRDALRILASGDADARAAARALLATARGPTVAEAALAALRPARDELDGWRLSRDAPWSLRLAEVEALSRGGGPSAVPPLARALRDDPNAWVRAAAAQGLREHAADAAARAALNAAASDPDPAVRDAARASLR